MAGGIRRDGSGRKGARCWPGGLTYRGGLPPIIQRRKFSRGHPFPGIITLKPILPHAVKAGIPGSIKAESMPPSLRICGLEDVLIDPLDEPEPDKLSLVGVRFAVVRQIAEENKTSLIEERFDLGGQTSLDLVHQTNPICEGAPLNEFRNRGAKPSGINEFQLRLGLVARPRAKSNLRFAVSSGHIRLHSILWGGRCPYDTPKLVPQPSEIEHLLGYSVEPEFCASSKRI